MKQISVIVAALFIISASLSSCIFSPTVKGNGNVSTENRSVSPFDEIKVSKGINLYITQGDEFRLTVKPPQGRVAAGASPGNSGANLHLFPDDSAAAAYMPIR